MAPVYFAAALGVPRCGPCRSRSYVRLTQIPIAVVVTKIDICPPTVLKQTRQALAKYLRQNHKMPYPIKDISQARILELCS